MTQQARATPAGDGVTVTYTELEYAPLPWNTHPIDTVVQQQGWGPFNGAWMPVDYESAVTSQSGGSGIDITWLQGDNRVDYAVPYAVLTIMQDRSLDFVNNQGFQATAQSIANAPQLASTIGQADYVQTTGVPPAPQGMGFMQSLRSLLATAKG